MYYQAARVYGPRAAIIVPAFTGQVVIPRGRQVRLTATITNVGDADGYFKLFGFLYSTACPAGSTGYNQSGWDKVASCVTDNTKGVSFNPYGGFELIAKGSSKTVQYVSEAAVNWTGPARLWIVAAVSTSSTGQPRLWDNEYYYFQDNIATIGGNPKSSISNVSITPA